jgi:hypothetical protein
MNVFAAIANLKCFAIEAPALAHRAGHPDVGEKIHFQPIRTVALAGLATAAGLVETESARLIAADLRVRHAGVERANFVKDLDVGDRIASRRASDRRLIDRDHLVDVLRPFNSIELRANFRPRIDQFI